MTPLLDMVVMHTFKMGSTTLSLKSLDISMCSSGSVWWQTRTHPQLKTACSPLFLTGLAVVVVLSCLSRLPPQLECVAGNLVAC